MQATRENLPCSNRLLTSKPNTPQQVSSAEVGGLQMPLKIFHFPLRRASHFLSCPVSSTVPASLLVPFAGTAFRLFSREVSREPGKLPGPHLPLLPAHTSWPLATRPHSRKAPRSHCMLSSLPSMPLPSSPSGKLLPILQVLVK